MGHALFKYDFNSNVNINVNFNSNFRLSFYIIRTQVNEYTFVISVEIPEAIYAFNRTQKNVNRQTTSNGTRTYAERDCTYVILC